MPEHFVKVAKTSDIRPGRVIVVELGDRNVAVCNVDGVFHAIDDVCTHDGGPLGQGELQGRIIECPRHGAQFDVTTGAAAALPASMPVDTFRVRVRGEDIEVEVVEG